MHKNSLLSGYGGALTPKNPFCFTVVDGEECVAFETVGKNKYTVLVDRDVWEACLSAYSWTAILKGNRVEVKTSIDKQSCRIWRVIAEHTYSELDYWGATVDHINNDPLDNRLCNLRLYNAAILNSTNVSSKYAGEDMQYIHENGAGYKIHFNLAGKTDYKQFSPTEYGSKSAALEAAKKYRDETVLPKRQHIIAEMIAKTRTIEFERGLRDKLAAGERQEILAILEKYGIHACEVEQ